jgi:hypothetical protein
MQGVMWLILMTTLGLSALVTHYRSRSFIVALSQPQTRQGVTVALPRDWVAENTSGATLFHLSEPEDSLPSRQLMVRRMPIPPQTPLADAILESADLTAVRIRQMLEIQMGGLDGLFLTATHSIDPRLDRAGYPGKFIVAAAPVHADEAMVVLLLGLGEIDNSDTDLVRRVAQSLELHAEAPTTERTQVNAEPDEGDAQQP